MERCVQIWKSPAAAPLTLIGRLATPPGECKPCHPSAALHESISLGVLNRRGCSIA